MLVSCLTSSVGDMWKLATYTRVLTTPYWQACRNTPASDLRPADFKNQTVARSCFYIPIEQTVLQFIDMVLKEHLLFGSFNTRFQRLRFLAGKWLVIIDVQWKSEFFHWPIRRPEEKCLDVGHCLALYESQRWICAIHYFSGNTQKQPIARKIQVERASTVTWETKTRD